jgi:hypothetical protein
MPKQKLTLDELIAYLNAEIIRVGTMTRWFTEHGFTPQFVSMVRHRYKPPSPKICEALGYRRVSTTVTSFERIEQ